MSKIEPKLHPEWLEILASEFEQDYFGQIKQHLLAEKAAGQIVYPPGPQIFQALELCPFSQVKVVILGQDPYHGPGQAHGLAFSVPDNTPTPPSLQNIFKEIQAEFGHEIPNHGNLSAWAQQGVLLLNTSLSVRAHMAASHSKIGWERFTDAIIQAVSAQKHKVFMLWGNHARAKKSLIASDQHLILEAPHPSPLSAHRGFLGCNHFKSCNDYLLSQGLEAIDWRV